MGYQLYQTELGRESANARPLADPFFGTPAILSGYSMESVEFHRVSVGLEKDKGNREVFNLELKNSGREWAGIESREGAFFIQVA